MTQHPITPPPELVKELWDKFRKTTSNTMSLCRGAEEIAWKQAIAQAVQWTTDQAKANIKSKLQEAADQELEACRHWLEVNGAPRKFIDGLLAFRRPKPPSLKEEALEELDAAILRGDCFSTSPAKDILRRAIESIPDPS
jgi:hypothetical protein